MERDLNKTHKRGIYEKYFKRFLDICCSLMAIVLLSPVMLIVAFLVRTKLGSPIVFKQRRPGLDEKIFEMYKFRTMTDARDRNGNLLPDDKRLTSFGKALRSTSCDELLELFNILKGDMAIVGPRPQLVKDMVFMTDEQRKRHTVRPGLSGLAQINGRNTITWEDKLDWDLKYIEKITFLGDVKIILKTVKKVFKREDINREGTDSDIDFGDYLLQNTVVNKEEYDKKQAEAKELLRKG